jgi:lipopolysaccharide export LptBFGC system permease protein LptF
MATRPARAQSANAQSAKAQAVKARSATAQAAKARPATAQSAKAQSAKAQPTNAQPAEPAATLPRALRVAAVLQGAEAVGMLVAAGLAAVATASGKSYELSSGIALTLIAVATAALFAAFAAGLARARPWTRTPVVMFQLAIGFWGVFLLTGHRPEWGVPMLLLAAAIVVAVFTPGALRALNRPPRQP